MPSPSGLRIHLSTFNLACRGAELSSSDLEIWLAPVFHDRKESQASAFESSPDVIVISLQETVPLHLSLSGFETKVLSHITESIAATLTSLSPDNTPYIPLQCSNLCSVALLVFCNSKTVQSGPFNQLNTSESTTALIPRAAKYAVEKVTTSTIGLGSAGMGNKAAVGVRVILSRASTGHRGSEIDAVVDGEENNNDRAFESFTFISAHLAAHDRNLARRNLDYRTILSHLQFSSGSSLTPAHQPHHTSHLFLCGDLNYRLSKLPSGIGYAMQEAALTEDPGHLEESSTIFHERNTLSHLDTLRSEQSSGRVAVGLSEGDLRSFAPTYKRIIGQVEGWNRKRLPGWTDRILFASYRQSNTNQSRSNSNSSTSSGTNAPTTSDRPDARYRDEYSTTAGTSDHSESDVRLLRYSSVPQVTLSDHKPVYAAVFVPDHPVDFGSTNIHQTPFLTTMHGYTPDRADTASLIARKSLGRCLDRTAGCTWFAALVLGGGNVIVGAALMVVMLLAGIALWSVGWRTR